MADIDSRETPEQPQADSSDESTSDADTSQQAATQPDVKVSEAAKEEAGKNKRGLLKDVAFTSNKPWLYHFFRYLMMVPPLRFCLRTTGYGVKKIPYSSGCILASNHASYLDPFVNALPVLRPLRFFARASLFLNKYFRWVISSLGAIPMERGASDIKAMRMVVQMLKDGDAVVMYPEGTRTRNGELQEFKPGVTTIAAMADVPIFPIYLHGTYETWGRHIKRMKLFRRQWVMVGDPIRMDDAPEELSKRESKKWAIEELRNRIKALETEARERWPLREYGKTSAPETDEAQKKDEPAST